MFTNAALTGTPTATTAVAGTNSTRIATTAFVNAALNSAFVTGTYMGDDTADRKINLGFTPKAVLVLGRGLEIYRDKFYGGLAITGRDVSRLYNNGTTSWDSGNSILGITSGGFMVNYHNSAGIWSNYSLHNSLEFFYIAFR
jgi:hypothetical protein